MDTTNRFLAAFDNGDSPDENVNESDVDFVFREDDGVISHNQAASRAGPSASSSSDAAPGGGPRIG